MLVELVLLLLQLGLQLDLLQLQGRRLAHTEVVECMDGTEEWERMSSSNVHAWETCARKGLKSECHNRHAELDGMKWDTVTM